MAILKVKMVAPTIIVGVIIFSIIAVISASYNANPVRDLPDSVSPGDSFNVTVTFTTPADNFNSIGIHEEAPTGWNVTVNKEWCTPNAYFAKADKNISEYLWYGPYESGTTFTVIYKVSVPSDAEAGTYAFNGTLEYYIGGEGPYKETMGGDKEVAILGPTPTPTPAPKASNFGAICAIVGVLAIAYLLLRRKKR